MTNFFRYLGYRMKDSALRTVVIGLLSFFYTLTFADSSIYSIDKYGTGLFVTCSLSFFCFLLIVLVFTIPLLELSRFKNRRNLDTLYFFPLSRIKLALAHFIGGFLQFLTAYTLSFSVIALQLCRTPGLHAGFLIPFYFVMLLASLMIYTVICYLFSSENTVFDGVSTVILWTFVPFLPSLLASSIGLSLHPDGFVWYFLYAPIIFTSQIFEILFKSGFSNTERLLQHFEKDWYILLLWFVLAGLAFYLYLRVFKKKGAEQAGAPSTSPVGLQFLIPAWGYIGFVLLFGSFFLAILSFMVMLSILVGYFILRRSFKLKKMDFICIGAIILAAILSTIIRPHVEKIFEEPTNIPPPNVQNQAAAEFDEDATVMATVSFPKNLC